MLARAQEGCGCGSRSYRSRVKQTSRRVVLTGAAGLIGRAVGPLLPQDWDLFATDLAAADGIYALDVTDREACGRSSRERTLSSISPRFPIRPQPERDLLPANVIGAYAVASAAATRRPSPRTRQQSAGRLGPPKRHAVTKWRRAAAGQPLRRDQGLGRGSWRLDRRYHRPCRSLRIGYFLKTRPNPATEAPRELSPGSAPAMPPNSCVASLKPRASGS